jgi:histidyl-tRNA synthetase
VVDQQVLHDRLLVGDRLGAVGVDDHAVGGGRRAGGLELAAHHGLELVLVAGVGGPDLGQADAALGGDATARRGSSSAGSRSGDGILGELFQAFSGKSPEEVKRVRETGRGPFALRPEFTPTLARMYAARAGQLPKPTKWFSVGPYFRAERPQRGRLREFLQWNCDVVGDEGRRADAEVMGACAGACAALGFVAPTIMLRVFSRSVVSRALRSAGVSDANDVKALELLDRLPKVGPIETDRAAGEAGLGDAFTSRVNAALAEQPQDGDAIVGDVDDELGRWLQVDPSIVRGLAYYTGTVFEVIADGERAVAGGGRYDNLIELLGGPPTPAVGFAMGDVVLSLLLEDKGLMPEGAGLLEACSGPGVSLRPEAFVVTADEELDGEVRRLVATLRRGVESEAYAGGGVKPWSAERYATRPLHARRSYKSTRKIGKLVQEANQSGARYAVILESESSASVKDLEEGEQETVRIEDLGAVLGRQLEE